MSAGISESFRPIMKQLNRSDPIQTEFDETSIELGLVGFVGFQKGQKSIGIFKTKNIAYEYVCKYPKIIQM